MASRAKPTARPNHKTADTRSTRANPSAKKAATKRPAGKKTAKKAAAKKTTAKTVGKKTAAKKTTAKKAAKKTAGKKTATKKTATTRPSAKKKVARKPAQETATKKPAARKSPAKPAKSPREKLVRETAPRGPFLELAALAGADGAHIAAALEAAPWDMFFAGRDLVPLRALLAELEAREGVGPAHRIASARLRGRGRLVHGLVHHVAISAVGLSHDGRYLATGSWCGDDYDRGGVLQIWEVAAGRCVHVLDPIRGGVGWPDYARQIQWSPDDRRLGVGHDTNAIGVFDPFGGRTPEATIDVTQGWSRPPSFCWSPDGQSIAVACWKWGSPPKIPIVIAHPLRGRIDDEDVRGMQPELPAALAATLQEDTPLQPMRDPVWGADGVIRGHNNHDQVFAVDAATGAIVWHGQAHEPLTFSPDGRYFADSPAGLVIYDGITGLPTPMLPMFVGAREHVWAPGESPRRLAMVVDADNEFGAEPGTHILDDGEHLVSLDEVPRASRWDEPDFRGLAFSRDGGRVALLDEEGRLAVFALAQGGARKTWERTLAGASGLWWGADDVLIAIGADLVVFLDGATGEPRGSHALRPEPSDESPLHIDGKDLGARLSPSPLLPVDVGDARRWAVAFPEGPIVCPDGARPQLDETVALVIDHRFAWPLRWTEIPVYPDLAAAAGDPALPLPPAALAKLTRPRRAARTPVWPPATGGTFVDLLRAHDGWLDELGREWGYHVAEHRTYLARIHVRLGDLAAARACVLKITDDSQRLLAAAAIAVQMHAAGAHDEARALAQIARKAAPRALAHELDTSMSPAAYAAALAVLGDPEAEARFAQAEAGLFPETNPFQHVGLLTTLLAELGRGERALEVLALGPWDGGDVRENYFAGALAAMTTRGEYDLVDRFFALYAGRQRWREEQILEATVGVALARGEFARALAWLPQFERTETDSHAQRAIRGLWALNERDVAWQAVEAQLEDPAWLAFAAQLDPTRIAARIEERLAAIHDDVRARHLTQLATAATHAGLGAQALAVPVTDDLGRLALATGVLAAKPTDALRAAAAAFVAGPLSRLGTSERDAVLDLAAAAHQAGLADLAAAAFARVQSAAIGREVRWVIGAIVSAAARVGALATAHAALLRMPRAQRVYEIRPLLLGCVERDEFAALIHLLSEIPNESLNDRGNLSMAMIAAAARARLPGIGEPH